MTKRQTQIIINHERATARFLSEVYASYSVAKENAFRYCEELMYKYNGYDFRIISYNTFMFTVGFYYIDQDTEQEMFMYITPSKDEKFVVK